MKRMSLSFEKRRCFIMSEQPDYQKFGGGVFAEDGYISSGVNESTINTKVLDYKFIKPLICGE